jgi:hypothetical protein
MDGGWLGKEDIHESDAMANVGVASRRAAAAMRMDLKSIFGVDDGG